MRNIYQGFSIVEMVLVVAVIAIIGSIAFGTYKNNLISSKISQGVRLLEAYKLPIVEHYESNGSFPLNTDLNLPIGPGSYPNISRIDFIPNSFTGINSFPFYLLVRFTGISTDTENKGVVLLVTFTNDSFRWQCRAELDSAFAMPAVYLPNNCVAP